MVAALIKWHPPLQGVAWDIVYNQGQPHTGALGEHTLEGGSPYGTPNPYGSIMLLVNHLETQHFPQDWKSGSLERCIHIQSTLEHFPEVRHIWSQWLTGKTQVSGFFTLIVHVPGQLLRLQKDQDCVFSTSYVFFKSIPQPSLNESQNPLHQIPESQKSNLCWLRQRINKWVNSTKSHSEIWNLI